MVSIKRKIILSSLLILLILNAFLLLPISVSASTSYSNNILSKCYEEFGLNIQLISWNQTTINLNSLDNQYLKYNSKIDFVIQNIIIFNDSNDNGFFEHFEENISILQQLNYSNFLPYPPSQVVIGDNAVPGILVNGSAWNSSTSPNVTFSLHALIFGAPSTYQGISFDNLETQLKLCMNISNWPSWGSNEKLLIVYNITSSLTFTSNGTSLISNWFDETSGPDVDDNEYKIKAEIDFFKNYTLNSSNFETCNHTIEALGNSNWRVNLTFNKFDNVTYNGSKIVFSLGSITNNFLSFVLFAIMLIGIFVTTVIIYYTRERRNKLLDELVDK
ncbi:MAG: hypothetical protein ACTSX4_03545 [Candidatus Helarchaeota archaeon]